MISDIVVAQAGAKGKGVFALRAFEKGEFIFRRRHDRTILNSDIPLLPESDQRHLCELGWNTSAVLLAPGCYLNHACDPNAMRKGVNVYAWRAIRAGEEITIDYRLNAFTGERCACACGGPNCRGHFDLSFFALPESVQHQYFPYAPAFIRKEFQRRRRARAHGGEQK